MWLQGFHSLMNEGKIRDSLLSGLIQMGPQRPYSSCPWHRTLWQLMVMGQKIVQQSQIWSGHLIVFTNIYESLSKKSPCVWGWYVQMDIARAPPKNTVYERNTLLIAFFKSLYFLICHNWIYCRGGQRSHLFGIVLSQNALHFSKVFPFKSYLILYMPK